MLQIWLLIVDNSLLCDYRISVMSVVLVSVYGVTVATALVFNEFHQIGSVLGGYTASL